MPIVESIEQPADLAPKAATANVLVIDDEEIIRIISARKANKKERRRYLQYLSHGKERTRRH